MFKKLPILLIALASFYPALAGVFIVSSNADSGPGTLREAVTLANANGNTVTDYINFNIADVSVAGRTILLLTALPDLSSNINIDGTTQPGIKIGVSDAKIRISNPDGTGTDYVFRIYNNKNIGIYGIHFHKINYNNFSSSYAIQLYNTENILIGAAGKGNYFTNLSVGVGNAGSNAGKGLNTGFSFKSNIVNLAEDGLDTAPNSNVMAISLTNVRDIEIGGDLPGEGNYMIGAGDVMVYIFTDTLANINLGYVKILNNKLGCDYGETRAINCGTIYLQNSNYFNYTDTGNITVKGNSYNSRAYELSNSKQIFFKVVGKKGFIDIKANHIGQLTSYTGGYYSLILAAIEIAYCENGIIGGDNPADTNYIAGCGANAIAVQQNKSIRITKNSIYCNTKGITASSTLLAIPITKIFTITDYNVQGTTASNSVVEVFLTQTCASCSNGKTYLGKTTADAAGNWSFTSPVILDGAVTATGTGPEGATGEFAKPGYIFNNYSYKAPACNQDNGYIHGMKFVSGTKYYWLRNLTNGTVDTLFSENIENAAPGLYTFVVEQGKYCSISFSQDLYDNSPKINSQYYTIRNPRCGLKNGGIDSHSISGSFNKIIWKDAAGNIVGNKVELSGAGAGQYKLIILDTTYGCGDSTGYYTLVNQPGPSLNTSNVLVTTASCTKNNGSITGITPENVTFPYSIEWVDSLNNPVGNNFDLINVLPGKYRLKYSDNTGCDTVITPFYTIADYGGIVIDTSHKLVVSGKCTGITGSIRQIQVTGGETYQWINTITNTAAGADIDLLNMPAGDYQLQVSNHYGCSNTSPVITIPPAAFIKIGVTGVHLGDAVCGQPNGNIQILRFDNDSNLYTFSWIDSSSAQQVGTGTGVYNLTAGTYYLFAKDSNGCEKKINTGTIRLLPPPVLDYSKAITKDDECDLHAGSISGIELSGLTGPTVYTWYDQLNNITGNTLNLQQAGVGVYTLKITDAGFCNVQSIPFEIKNTNDGFIPPQYQDLVIPRYSDALLSIKNAAPGNYILFAGAGGNTLLQQNTGGNFTVPKIATDTSFYIQRVNGTCTSPLVRVNIKVVDKSYFSIATAFTPNGDGKNDRLHVKVTGYINLNYFRVFNRHGQLVFETHRLNDGWDGRWKGILQDTGGFVWIAEGKDINGKLVTDKGSFILVK